MDEETMDAVEGRRVVSRERVVWLDDVEEVLCVRVLDKWDAMTVGLINDTYYKGLTLKTTSHRTPCIFQHIICENLQAFLTVD